MPTVLCIAGLDPSHHSGLSADKRALNFMGIHCLPVASVVTVQDANTFSEMHHVPPDLIKKQLDAILQKIMPDAIKIGVIGNSDVADLIVEYFSDRKIPMVIDPVFKSTTGFEFIDDCLLDIYKNSLIPLSRILTPNAYEAARITGQNIETLEDAESACRRIFELKPEAVLVKGGHIQGSRGTDIFLDKNGMRHIKTDELDIKVRGTGCTYSSIIAGHLSMGFEAFEAVSKAKLDLHRALLLTCHSGGKTILFEEPASQEQQPSPYLLELPFSDAVLKAIERNDFKIEIIRGLQENCTESVINTGGFVPDVVFDKGYSGKESVAKLLANNPAELIEKLRRILECTE